MLENEQWMAWLNRHGSALLLLARQWVVDRSEAEDVVQEAFLRFWRSHAAAQDATAYLYACVRNCAIEFRRGHSRRQAREQSVARPERTPDWFVSRPERQERDARIRRVLDDLPEPQREVVVMRLWGRLSFEQIAVALTIPANTAASRYRYALQKLRAELAEEHVS